MNEMFKFKDIECIKEVNIEQESTEYWKIVWLQVLLFSSLNIIWTVNLVRWKIVLTNWLPVKWLLFYLLNCTMKRLYYHHQLSQICRFTNLRLIGCTTQWAASLMTMTQLREREKVNDKVTNGQDFKQQPNLFVKLRLRNEKSKLKKSR